MCNYMYTSTYKIFLFIQGDNTSTYKYNLFIYLFKSIQEHIKNTFIFKVMLLCGADDLEKFGDEEQWTDQEVSVT